MTLLGCLFSLGCGFKPSCCFAHFPDTLPVQLLNALCQTFSSYCVGYSFFPTWTLRETSSRHAFSSTILIVSLVSLWGKRKRLWRVPDTTKNTLVHMSTWRHHDACMPLYSEEKRRKRKLYAHIHRILPTTADV